MRNYKTEGIVLKRTNFKEADKILTVFTKVYGKLHLLAHGIRKTNSHKASSLESFSQVKLFIANGRNLDIITEVESVNNFNNLRLNLKKVGMAYQLCELVDRLSPEKQVNRSLYILLSEELAKLDRIESDTQLDLKDFIMKLLWDLGFLPREKILTDLEIKPFVEEIIERSLKSDQLLTKIESILY